MGPDRPSSLRSRDPGPLRHTLRSLFAVLAAALAFACAGAGSGAGSGAGEARGVATRSGGHQPGPGVERAAHALPSLARILLRGGGPLVHGPSRRAGSPPPRLAPGTPPSDDLSVDARTAALLAAGARSGGVLPLALARRMAAFRDGTLSSRSNGVPPPVRA
jgi:hypothetical protein